MITVKNLSKHLSYSSYHNDIVLILKKYEKAINDKYNLKKEIRNNKRKFVYQIFEEEEPPKKKQKT